MTGDHEADSFAGTFPVTAGVLGRGAWQEVKLHPAAMRAAIGRGLDDNEELGWE